MIDLQFEDDIGRVTRGDVKVMLSQMHYRLFRILAAARGAMVPTPEIKGQLYPGQSRSRAIVQVTAFKLRKRIEPLGLEIVAVKGVGYGLAEARK